MAYGILEVTSGNLTTESHVIDHNGNSLTTREVVERLNELEADVATWKASAASWKTISESWKDKLRTAGWFPLD